MATIVQVKRTGKNYFLLGAGFGMYQSSMPGVLGGSLTPDIEEGSSTMLAVSDESGNIHYVEPEMVRVLCVDGVRIDAFAEVLNDGCFDIEYDKCPACSGKISYYDKVCPSCGLRFGE